MAVSADRTHLFGADYPVAFQTVCSVAEAEAMTITSADPAAGAIALKTRMTVFSWGENLGAQVHAIAPGAVSVRLWSGLKFGLVDWGRNVRNLDRFFARLATVLPPAPGSWHPDPSGRHALRWWDGSTWTDQVSDSATTGLDPIG